MLMLNLVESENRTIQDPTVLGLLFECFSF